MVEQPKESMLYQDITEMLFESSVKEVVAPSDVSNEAEHNEGLTFEEDNAIRYVRGFVIHSLHKSKAKEEIGSRTQDFN